MPSISLQPPISRLLASITKMEQLKPVRGAVRAAALHIEGKIKKYPDATDANASGPYPKRWYQRGYGPRWAKAGGGTGGRKTSETLGRKWTIKLTNNGMTAQVGNNVSYGPYVQSAEDQARVHGKRGWLTDQKVIDQEGEFVLGLIGDAVDQALEQI